MPDSIKKQPRNPAQSTIETLKTNIQNKPETEINYQILSIENSTDESTSDSSTIPKPVKITKLPTSLPPIRYATNLFNDDVVYHNLDF